MRLNVVTIALSASFLVLSAVDTTTQTSLSGTSAPTQAPGTASSAPIVKVLLPSPTSSQTPYVINSYNTTTLSIDQPDNINIIQVALKIYNKDETDGQKDDDVTYATFPDRSRMLHNKETEICQNPQDSCTWTWNFINKPDTIQIKWNNIIDDKDHPFRDLPVYVECKWGNSTDTGSSTSQLFAVYKDSKSDFASANLTSLQNGINGSPARAETHTLSSTTSSAPSSTTPQEPPTSPTSKTSQTPTTTSASPKPAPNGLSQGGKIGIAVGVSIAGLLVAAVVSWFLCLRRRRHDRNLPRHGMSSYESDLGARAMIADKEAPMRLESSSRQSAYGGVGGVGGIGDGGRASTDQQQQHQYAPYSDRSTTAVSPTTMPFPQQQQQPQQPQQQPQQQQPHGMTTSPDATVVDQQHGDLSRSIGVGGGNAPASVPGAPTSYVHLIEDGMTAEEIRRLEEEERQLDAAIENAGRTGNS